MRNEVVAFLLVVVLIVSAGAGYFAGSSNKTTTTTVSTTTQTTTATETTTPRSVVGDEVQCGFATTCNVFNSAGLELLLSVNSTSIKPNGTIALNVTEFNPLPVTNNASASANFVVQGLLWGCNTRSYFPHGIAIFRGYYTLSNLTAGYSLDIWAGVPCIADFVGNGTNGIVGFLQNVSSYSFMPQNYNASYSAYYEPSPPHTGSFGTFLPTPMMTGTTITAANYSPLSPLSHEYNSLGSSAPGVYTLVAGDEWGDLEVAHFSVI